MLASNLHKFSEGDIVSFTIRKLMLKYENPTRNFNRTCPPEAMDSSYGYNEYPIRTIYIDKETGEIQTQKYKIVEVTTQIPHQTIWNKTYIPKGHTNQLLILEPIGGLDTNEMMCWFINLTQFTISQYKDAMPLFYIDSLYTHRVDNHSDRVNC
jgi:hypothetical protein